MRVLANQAGVQPPDGDYPKGRIVDSQTVIGEGVNGDIVQFFQKLIQLAGVTENDLPDNESNGYQMVEALIDEIKNVVTATPTFNALSMSNGWISHPDDPAGYYIDGAGIVHLLGTVRLPANEQLYWNFALLPTDARPQGQKRFLNKAYQYGGSPNSEFIIEIISKTNGDLAIDYFQQQRDSGIDLDVTLDGICYSPKIVQS